MRKRVAHKGGQPESAAAAPAPTEWRIGRQLIRQADCLAALADLPPESVDLCITSPPYNLGIAYRSYEDRLPRDHYLDWMAEIGRAIARVLTPHGSFFLNVGGTGQDPWIAADVADRMTHDFVLQNHIIWVKSLSIGDDSLGHFKPINSRRFLNNNHESIYHFSKEGHATIDRLAVGVPFKDKSNIARFGHAHDKRCAGNVWFLPYETVRSRAQKFDHPAGFPVSLPERCIRLAGLTDPLVLDPFLGAGTTLVAAERLGARGLGFETDATYAARAADRVRAALAR